MKIAITTVGTRGDLQPYIALGLGLKDAGHEVLIVSSKNPYWKTKCNRQITMQNGNIILDTKKQ